MRHPITTILILLTFVALWVSTPAQAEPDVEPGPATEEPSALEGDEDSTDTDEKGIDGDAPSVNLEPSPVVLDEPVAPPAVGIYFADSRFTCTPEDVEDADGNAITYTYKWMVNGKHVGVDGDSFRSTTLKRGDTVQCMMVPQDDLAQGKEVGSDVVTVANSLPVVGSVVLKPKVAKAGDTLTCTAEDAVDADGDGVKLNYAWLVDGARISHTDATYQGKDGMIVGCQITPNDGVGDGAVSRSAVVGIGNDLPIVSGVTVNPEGLDSNEPPSPVKTDSATKLTRLRCLAGKTSDPNGNNVALKYAWEVNGARIDATPQVLTGEHFDRGDSVVCLVTPNDGIADGDAVSSDPVVIKNAVPSVKSVALTLAGDDKKSFIPHETSVLNRLTSFLGIFGFVLVALLLSENRKRVNWRTVGWGIGLQLLFGAVVLSPWVSDFFYTVVNGGVAKLLEFANDGSAFIFATIHPHQSSTLNFGTGEFEQVTYGFSDSPPDNWSPAVKNLAFVILPTIIFFSALMSMLYHLGVMQWVVKGIAWLMVRTLGTSGAESLSAAGNIFVGQTEAPLLIKPFVNGMTRSELMAVMTGGFATVAGGVLGAYVSFLSGSIPDIAGHLVIASIISAPAALAIAKVMVPETAKSQTAGEVNVEFEANAKNVMEAVANGATDGMKLVLNVAAMLIAIVAIVSMFNWLMGIVPVRFCGDVWSLGYSAQCAANDVVAEALTLSDVMGWIFFPFAFMMGVPWSDCGEIGQLLGEKIVLTEFLAYIHLGSMINGEAVITERSAVIASYALCGFANFASIGIQLGGIGGIAPKRMGDLASLGFKAMIGGAIAACMTGAVAGLFL